MLLREKRKDISLEKIDCAQRFLHFGLSLRQLVKADLRGAVVKM